nr:Gag-Pol polyprotein [Tanacetum cinerariifolium]
MALGYQNPFYLKQAQKKQQSLYDGKVLLEKHDPPVVHDSKETLQLAQENREKMKQPNKEIKPANYTKINHLLGVFVPQMAKSHKELYFSNISKTANVSKSISIPNDDFSDDTTPEAATFVGDFKSLANEADESLAKYKALEWEIERLLKAVVSQDIMNIVQKESIVDTSYLQTELKRTKERFENCIIKKENEYAILWNDCANTKFAKQSIVENLPKVGETHALSNPVTSNSVSTPQESKGVNNDKVIAPGMFRINPFMTSKEEKHVPNTVRASTRTKPITDSQPLVFTKKDVNSDSNGLSATGIDNTKTRTPQPRSNTKTDRVPSANDHVSGLPKFKYHKEHLCPSCEQGKSKRASHPPKLVLNSRQRLHLLHMDLCGPMRIASINGKRIYNQRTKKIMETMNVLFDELLVMAFEQRSLKPGLQSMTSGQISLGLDLNYAPSNITTQQPTEGELDLLFEAMYDDYTGGQSSASARTIPPAQEPKFQPKNVKEAMTDLAWIDSMQEELLRFKRLNVWVLVPAPDYISPLTLKWLFKNKHDEEQTVIRNKSRLVVRGYRQEEGIDFEESFAPALYGLKQAPRAWYDELSTFLLQNHFFNGTIDPTLFIRCFYDDILVVQVYVDDIIFGSTHPSGAQFLGEKLVSWSLKKQDCTTLSTAKAEYVSLFACCAQVLWMRTQLTDYGFHFNKIPIYCDSKSAIAISISCNSVQHSRTKHIAVCYHFIKEHVEKGTIELYFVKTDYQLADLFTKALPADHFNYLVYRLGMRSLSPQELEHLAKSQ